MVEKFSSFFVNTDTNQASKIPHDKTNFESYLQISLPTYEKVL